MKRVLIVIGIVIGSLLLVVCSSMLLLQHSKIQTYLVGYVTKKLSNTLNADVTIQRIHYRPLNQLTVDSLFISDQQHDTLAFVEQANIQFNFLQLPYKRLDFMQLQLQKPYVNIYSINDSVLNYQFLQDMLQRPDTTLFPLRVNIDKLQLSDLRFRYNELLVDNVNIDLALPIFSADSMDLQIHQMSLRAQLGQLGACLEANIHGGLDSIFVDKILLSYNNIQLFNGDITVYHPTQIEQLYTQVNCQDLYCNYALLQDIIAQLTHQPVKFPKIVANLGHIHYRGNIKGRLENMNLIGSFSSQLGIINVNGGVQIDTTFQDINFHGYIAGNDFQLGKLINDSDFGELSFHANMDGELDSFQLTKCIGTANIQKLQYKGYTYDSIYFDGEMQTEEVSGLLRINDENINLTLNGLVDWSQEDTRLNIVARIDDFSPAATHLTYQYPDLSINATTYVSLFTSGSTRQMLDNLTGYVIVDTLELRNADKYASIKKMEMRIDTEENNKQYYHQINIQSDFLTASLSGAYSYSSLTQSIQQMLHQYLPSLIPQTRKRHKSSNELSFYAYFRNLQPLCEVFDIGMDLPSVPTFKGYMHEKNNQLNLQAYIPNINTSGAQMENLTLAIDNMNDQLSISAHVFNRLPKENPTAAKIGDVKADIQLLAAHDKINATIQLENTDSVQNEGTIRLSSHIMQYANKPLISTHIQPTTIILNDSTWTIDEANIVYNASEQRLDIHDLSLNTNYQMIAANGSASKYATDSINVELRNIDVQYLLSYTLASEALSVQGPLTGRATLYSLFSMPIVEAQAYIPNAGLNNTYLGDLNASAYWDHPTNSIIIEGQAIDSTDHLVADVNGKVIPDKKWWGLDIKCDSIDIGLIDFWTHDFFANPQGRAYGDLQIFGQDHLTWVTTKLYGKNVQLMVPQIGATFQFSDSIFMDSTSIRIPRLDIFDTEGNKGTFEGIISHSNFQDFQYNLSANVNNMLVLNLPEDPQSLFYGKVYGTGNLSITGDEYNCKIAVDARTENYSKFYLSVNTASTANTSSFIHFTAPDTTNQLLRLLNSPTMREASTITPSARLLLSLQIEVTPTTEIQINMGGDDGIRGRGEGNIQISYDDSSEEIQMLGSYTLQSGLFAFTLGNIVHRNFEIAEGSRVIWSGDPLSPTVDIVGKYRTTASLRDLFGNEFSQVATNRSSVPVNCVLYMKDLLFNPILNFDVELPLSDESVQSQVHSVINTEEMKMRQIIYLLVFNRFYTPDYLQGSHAVGLNETYSLLSSTVTGQINAWLSKLTDIFTMGFNFRTDGEGETASQEYEANFQLRPINQLIINGNFGYRYNDLSNRPFFGDLDIEYLLTPNGKLRAKAYTHTVDKYSLKQANTVQGIGLVFKHDFNWQTRKKDKYTQSKRKIRNK